MWQAITLGCNACYIGETSRPLSERFEEHKKKDQSAFRQHISESGHKPPDLASRSVKVIDKEQHMDKRRLLEAMYIKVNNPSLNANVGKYDIPPIYSDIMKENGQLSIHT